MNTATAHRATYKKIAQEIMDAAGWTAEKVNEVASEYAHQMADGEERTTGDWVDGICELQYLISKGIVR